MSWRISPTWTSCKLWSIKAFSQSTLSYTGPSHEPCLSGMNCFCVSPSLEPLPQRYHSPGHSWTRWLRCLCASPLASWDLQPKSGEPDSPGCLCPPLPAPPGPLCPPQRMHGSGGLGWRVCQGRGNKKTRDGETGTSLFYNPDQEFCMRQCSMSCYESKPAYLWLLFWRMQHSMISLISGSFTLSKLAGFIPCRNIGNIEN